MCAYFGKTRIYILFAGLFSSTALFLQPVESVEKAQESSWFGYQENKAFSKQHTFLSEHVNSQGRKTLLKNRILL
jgi:hypothetical protein